MLSWCFWLWCTKWVGHSWCRVEFSFFFYSCEFPYFERFKHHFVKCLVNEIIFQKVNTVLLSPTNDFSMDILHNYLVLVSCKGIPPFLIIQQELNIGPDMSIKYMVITIFLLHLEGNCFHTYIQVANVPWYKMYIAGNSVNVKESLFSS